MVTPLFPLLPNVRDQRRCAVSAPLAEQSLWIPLAVRASGVTTRADRCIALLDGSNGLTCTGHYLFPLDATGVLRRMAKTNKRGIATEAPDASTIEAKDLGLIASIRCRYGWAVYGTRHGVAVQLFKLVKRYGAFEYDDQRLDTRDHLFDEWTRLLKGSGRPQIECVLISGTTKNEVCLWHRADSRNIAKVESTCQEVPHGNC